MSEKRGEITFAGPPKPGFAWGRAVLAVIIIAAAAFAARERFIGRVAEQGAVLQDLHREYLALAGTLDWLADLHRPRPGPPLSATETATLLETGEMTPLEVLAETRKRRPYRGPSERELLGRKAASRSALEALYDRASGAGLGRDDADLRIVRMARGATPTAVVIADEDAVPDVPGAVRTAREEAGLGPIERRGP